MERKEAVVLNVLCGVLKNESVLKKISEFGVLTIDNGEETIKLLRVLDAFYICHTNNQNPNDVILGVFYPSNNSSIYSSLESRDEEAAIFDIRHLIAVLVVKGKSLAVDEQSFIMELQNHIETLIKNTGYNQKPKSLEFLD